MPRKAAWPPKIYTDSGRDRIRIPHPDRPGKYQWIPLGPTGSEESKREYARVVAELAAHGGRPAPATGAVTVARLCERHLAYSAEYHDDKQRHRIRRALARVVNLYGDTPADDFGPLKLQAVRQSWIDERPRLSRRYVNHLTRAVQECWRWGVSQELVTGGKWQLLCAVPGVRRGKTAAKEMPKVRPADRAAVEATLPYLPPVVADLVRLLALTGMRPGEACALCPADIDRDWLAVGGVPMWCARFDEHKTAWRGQHRWVPLGPRAQALLAPYLDGRDPQLPCFSPRETARWYCQKYGRAWPERWRERGPGVQYRTQVLDRTVLRAVRRAGVKKWSPNQVRHLVGTEVEVAYDRDHARCVLGHASPNTTAVYAEWAEKAAAVLARIG